MNINTKVTLLFTAAVMLAGCAAATGKGSAELNEESAISGELTGESARVAEEWEIRVPGGAMREYIVSNREATHFSCESAGPNSRSYHGLYCAMHEYLDSYVLRTGGRDVKADEISEARAYPHALYRYYETHGLVEKILLPDYENGLVVSFSGLDPGRCELVPWIDMRFIWDVPSPEYRVFWEKGNNCLLVSRMDDPFEAGRPKWIAVTASAELDFEPDEKRRSATWPKDEARKAMGRTNPFSPGRLVFDVGEGSGGRVIFAFGLGETEEDALQQAAYLVKNEGSLSAEKFERIDGQVRGETKIRRAGGFKRAGKAHAPRVERIPGGGEGDRPERRYCVDPERIMALATERMREDVMAGEATAGSDARAEGGAEGEAGEAAGTSALEIERKFTDYPAGGMPKMPEGTPESLKAYRWARASMDNLIMNQRGRGIYAGYHWFVTYWGRDSFISLPGACLSTGRLGLAREILVSFMEFQQTDPGSSRQGRMPNIVDPENLQYAGVDGTWWFVRAAWKYFEASGDVEFLMAAWPRIWLAIEGALEKDVDELGFLTHGDGETWMDAGGENNPYSPRGTRAVEVQALFHHGLVAGALWTRALSLVIESAESGSPFDGDDPGAIIARGMLDSIDRDMLETAFEKWTGKAALLAGNFRERFWNEEAGYLYDHLDADGSRDIQVRPNAVLALWVYLDTVRLAGISGEIDRDRYSRMSALLSPAQFARVVRTASERVVLPHGVTSLDPADPHFHPRHLDLDNYYYDEAYHNGDVWEWLSGPMISCLVAGGDREKAGALLRPMVREILEEGCVGSLREIQDGEYTPGKEEFGGATSQAWTLAEFIRVVLGYPGLGRPE